MKNFNTIQAELNQFIGTETFYHRLFKKSVYTNGFFTFMNFANTHWLYDIIETEILSIALKGNLNLDTYSLKFNAADSYVELQLIDWKGNILWSKKTFSCFEYKVNLSFVVGWDGERLITCLTSEN